SGVGVDPRRDGDRGVVLGRDDVERRSAAEALVPGQVNVVEPERVGRQQQRGVGGVAGGAADRVELGGDDRLAGLDPKRPTERDAGPDDARVLPVIVAGEARVGAREVEHLDLARADLGLEQQLLGAALGVPEADLGRVLEARIGDRHGVGVLVARRQVLHVDGPKLAAEVGLGRGRQIAGAQALAGEARLAGAAVRRRIPLGPLVVAGPNALFVGARELTGYADQLDTGAVEAHSIFARLRLITRAVGPTDLHGIAAVAAAGLAGLPHTQYPGHRDSGAVAAARARLRAPHSALADLMIGDFPLLVALAAFGSRIRVTVAQIAVAVAVAVTHLAVTHLVVGRRRIAGSEHAPGRRASVVLTREPERRHTN